MGQDIELRNITGEALASRTIHPYGCVILRCVDGYARLSVNHQQYALRKGELCIITSDVFLSFVSVSRHFSAKSISFPEALFNTVYYRVTNMAIWDFLFQNPVLRLSGQQAAAFDEWLSLINWTIGNTAESVYWEIITSMACALFSVIDDQLTDIYGKAERVSKDARWAIIVRFYTLLYKHYKEFRNVKFYADELNISTDYLNKVIRRIYGVSPKRLINEQLTEDIKFRLAHTDQSIKEISQHLHFEDSSYFCRYFRKQTGVSPMAYRKQH